MRSIRVATTVAMWTLFVVAIFFGLTRGAPQNQIGALFIAVGAIAVSFSHAVSGAHTDAARRVPFLAGHAEKIRPLTVTLWGIGMLIVGTAWAFIL